MERTTLVTKLTILRPDGVDNLTDVPTHVAVTPRRTTITFGYPRTRAAVVTLINAERIALIEALGGTA